MPLESSLHSYLAHKNVLHARRVTVAACDFHLNLGKSLWRNLTLDLNTGETSYYHTWIIYKQIFLLSWFSFILCLFFLSEWRCQALSEDLCLCMCDVCVSCVWFYSPNGSPMSVTHSSLGRLHTFVMECRGLRLGSHLCEWYLGGKLLPWPMYGKDIVFI